MQRFLSIGAQCALAGLCAALTVSLPAAAESPGLKDGRIGYALTSLHWATYQTADGKQECPEGFNMVGPRETFKALFPQDKGQQWTELESHLKREVEGWYPTDQPSGFRYIEAVGPTAYGMNLDGKIGPNDFTSPEGEKGIDNQLYRALGCSNHYRGPDGQTDYFDNKAIVDDRYNRNLIEITGVDSLVNDADVQVTMMRGLDRLLTDATGNTIMPGGSQRIDTKHGGRFVYHLHGKIVDGVLTTDAADVVFPWTTVGVATVQMVHDLRFKLKLTPTGAEGMMAGYTDLDNWYSQLMKSETTHYEAYGQLSPPDLHRALSHLADAYPDPKTGKFTAISSALRATYAQVFIIHPPAEVASALPPKKSALDAVVARGSAGER